jgi:CheY-like chemotaxis protein
MTLRLAIVADDDEDARYLVAAALRRAGFGVSEAEDGVELLSLMEQHHDLSGLLIVSDVGMPRCDGIAATHVLRGRDPNLPILLITAFADADTKLNALRAGANRVFQKPLDLTQLVKAAVELSGSRRSSETRSG